jgi:glycyl-tRNA synthetase
VSIGKRYARTDELGVPFAITLDPVTVHAGTVTLRERDSTKQIRVGVKDAVAAIIALAGQLDTWDAVASRFEPVAPPIDE